MSGEADRLVRLAVAMRKKQREYFKSRDAAALSASKAADYVVEEPAPQASVQPAAKTRPQVLADLDDDIPF
jgi:hypothetical protein